MSLTSAQHPPSSPNPIIKAFQGLLHAAQINDEGLTWRCGVKLTGANEAAERRLCTCVQTYEVGQVTILVLESDIRLLLCKFSFSK